MKSGWVLLIVFAAVAASAALHYHKNKGITDEVTRIEQGLSGSKNILSPGSRLSLITIPANSEVISLARFALAPVSVSSTPTDTVLYITFPDSIIDLTNKHLVWEHRDDRYKYTLTTTR